HASGNLAWGSLLAGLSGGEGEGAACTDADHTADDALFSHAHSHSAHDIAALLQQAHHFHVVRKGTGGRHNFDVVGRELAHLLPSLFQFSGSAIVVRRDD